MRSDVAGSPPCFSVTQRSSYQGIGVGSKAEGRKCAARIACLLGAMTGASAAGCSPEDAQWAQGKARVAWSGARELRVTDQRGRGSRGWAEFGPPRLLGAGVSRP
eukprot:12072941-Alexandrium_andersonii.AAC.1